MPSAEHGTGHAFESWFYYGCYEVFFNTLYKLIFCHDLTSKSNTPLLGSMTVIWQYDKGQDMNVAVSSGQEEEVQGENCHM
jgi:hypothetical protein